MADNTTTKEIVDEVHIGVPEAGTVRVVTWNVNYDTRAELPHPVTKDYPWQAFRWSERKGRVLRVLEELETELSPDVICLQELRDESLSDICAWVASRRTYDISYGRTNSGDQALCLATLWNKSRWLGSISDVQWFSKNGTTSPMWNTLKEGNGFGRILTETTLFPAAYPNPKIDVEGRSVKKSPSFTVYNVHMGLARAERLIESHTLAFEVKNSTKIYDPYDFYVVCGDFNTFPDDGGPEQMDLLDAGELREHIPYPSPLRVADYDASRSGNKVLISTETTQGTHVPYPYDTFIRDKGLPTQKKCPNDGEYGSRLDHILHTAQLTATSTVLYLSTGTGVAPPNGCLRFDSSRKSPTFPSDHLPLIEDLCFGKGTDVD